MTPAGRLAVCFCLGALLGTALDGIHLYGDVESYPDPLLGRWAWFVPLEFGAVAALVGVAIPHLERLVGPASPPFWSGAVRIVELCVIVIAYTATVLLADAPVVVTLILLTLVAGRLALAAVPGDWAYALIAGITGPAAEAALAATGAFDYADPDFAGIPMWLPILWANGGLFIRRLLVPVVLRTEYRGLRPPQSGGLA